MSDLTMNAKLPETGVMSGFVRENSVQPQPLKKSIATAEAEAEASKSTETQERQEIASEKSPTDFVKEASKKQLDQTVTQLNGALQNVQRNLEFSIDKDAGQIVINVIDKETDKIVRQIPSEEVLELARNLHKISRQASEELEEQISKRSEHSSIDTRGVLFKTTSV